ncbi:F-box/FBD/LRR-repeat protein At4g26340-like [Lotus japonicus]|uniref:F-box/FBD/LRR-repeat protein At4g26340-like n=1 Tax=Lotus japonicus TaxID=34305 RepID=UPI0025860C52|nr:F-box/FBD/LRR-repeat protein At4g26340-like [Lotus japonicus]
MVDRISTMPEGVLSHILSFLPAEDAFATRLLSKKWKPLWLLTPTLDFDQHRSGNLLPSPSSFTQFIYAAILGRSIHQPIKTLRLKGRYCSNLHLNIWLNAAAERQVQTLEVDIPCREHLFPILPCSIFSIKTLVLLKLKDVAAFFDAFSVELPSLKVLHLDTARFLDPQHLMMLLNGCPILETLKAEGVTFKVDDGPSSSFKSNFKTLSKLVKADVIHVMMMDYHIPVRIFCHAEFLRLDKYCDVDIPIFSNLIDLELISGFNVQWKSLIDMLNRCPQLQTFVFENIARPDDDDNIWLNTHVDVPECFSSQLRRFDFINFTGKECEMRFIKFVMQNSTSLRTMTISSMPDLNLEKKHAEMLEELASCPRSCNFYVC